jgi:hypothetical protein
VGGGCPTRRGYAWGICGFSPFAPQMLHSSPFPGAKLNRHPAIWQHPNHLQVIIDIRYQYAIIFSLSWHDSSVPCEPMRPRPAVLLTPSKPSYPTQLPFRQHFARVSPLDATLMVPPASVANRRLTAELNPLDATLTKNRGWGLRPSTFRRPSLQTFQTCFQSIPCAFILL